MLRAISPGRARVTDHKPQHGTPTTAGVWAPENETIGGP